MDFLPTLSVHSVVCVDCLLLIFSIKKSFFQSRFASLLDNSLSLHEVTRFMHSMLASNSYFGIRTMMMQVVLRAQVCFNINT